MRSKIREGTATSIANGEAEGFEWFEFQKLVKDFKRTPQRYTDAFFPFLSESEVLSLIEEELEGH